MQPARFQIGDPKTMIFVIASIKTTDEDRPGLIEAARACIEETRKEPGNLSYDLHQSVTDPNSFVFVERWQDREVLEAHFASKHLAVWREIAAPLIVEKSVEIISPESVEGL